MTHEIKPCCLSGFEWDGKPKGTEGKLAGLDCYNAGANDEVALLVVADLFGWTFTNTRLLCDHYAKEINASVYMPDYFDGEVFPAEILVDRSRWGEVDIAGWMKRNSRQIRWPEIEASAEALRAKYKRVGVIGYCFGGWAGLELGSSVHQNPPLVDCVSIAHPTWTTKDDFDKIAVPVQIVAPEVDEQFPVEMKAYANTVIPTKGVPYEYVFFPGVEHAFATRGDPRDEKEQKAMLRAKRAQVNWTREWLHGDGY